MRELKSAQRIISDFDYGFYIPIIVEAFLVAKRAENLSPGTIRFYHQKLTKFVAFCDSRAVMAIPQIDANLIRGFLDWLKEQGHNEGGIHGHYRAVKAFLRWWEVEEEPSNWRNPFRKVKAPKVKQEPLEPVETIVIKKLLDACDSTFTGRRDKAILMLLLDTGIRANELIMLNLSDLDLIRGTLVIRNGKGGKFRKLGLGTNTRKTLSTWLRIRRGGDGPLFIQALYKDQLLRLHYDGLRAIVKRRADIAGVESPPLHSFRRTFALTMLNSGVDVFSLQRLMGHSSIHTLRQYLAQSELDLILIQRQHSPTDRLLSGAAKRYQRSGS